MIHNDCIYLLSFFSEAYHLIQLIKNSQATLTFFSEDNLFFLSEAYHLIQLIYKLSFR